MLTGRRVRQLRHEVGLALLARIDPTFRDDFEHCEERDGVRVVEDLLRMAALDDDEVSSSSNHREMTHTVLQHVPFRSAQAEARCARSVELGRRHEQHSSGVVQILHVRDEFTDVRVFTICVRVALRHVSDAAWRSSVKVAPVK